MDCQRERPKIVKLERRRRLSNHFPDMDKLNIMGFHSMNTNYEFEDNLSQLRYLKLPAEQNVNLDLKITAGRTVRRKLTTNQIKIDHVLKWILAHRKEYSNIASSRCIGEIVCYRGLLSKVMSSPYENNEGWIICATKFQGKYFLCNYDNQETIMAEENQSQILRNFGDWGLVFDQYMTSVHPKHLPDMSFPTDQNEELHCVFRRRLGHHNLLYGAEMDALKIDDKYVSIENPISDPAKLKDLLEKGHAKFVELKTSFDPLKSQRVWSKICRIKSLRWWVKCYMSGIQEVICGYRGANGIVTSLQTFRVGNLPQLGRGHWNPDVCLDYCSRFLDLVTNHVSNGPDEVIWSFTWNPQNPNNIEIEEVDKDSQYSFLHGWFTDELRKNNKEERANPSTSSLRDPSDDSKA